MSTLVYATTDDLTAWMAPTQAPANAVQLLRTASMAVREATITAYYAIDGNGLPTDTDTLQAFKDATCAQAAAMSAAGIDPLSGGVFTSKTASQKQIGTARVAYADAGAAAESRASLLDSLCVEAGRILQQAGLVTRTAWTVG